MKYEIAKLANKLCELLEFCDDADFVDKVCASVASNDRIDLDEIEENKDDFL